MIEMRKGIKERANSRREDVDKNEHMDWNEDGYKDGKGQAGVGSKTGAQLCKMAIGILEIRTELDQEAGTASDQEGVRSTKIMEDTESVPNEYNFGEEIVL